MSENEKTLKALSLIAAELYLHNLLTITIGQGKGKSVDYSYASEKAIPQLAEHFKAYFEGGRFSPMSVAWPKGGSIKTKRL